MKSKEWLEQIFAIKKPNPRIAKGDLWISKNWNVFSVKAFVSNETLQQDPVDARVKVKEKLVAELSRLVQQISDVIDVNENNIGNDGIVFDLSLDVIIDRQEK